MSFEVRAQYDFDMWPEADEIMFEVAGRKCDFAGTDFRGRDLGWVEEKFSEAVEMRQRLEAAGASAQVRENTTHPIEESKT